MKFCKLEGKKKSKALRKSVIERPPEGALFARKKILMRGRITPYFQNSTVSPVISHPWHSLSLQVPDLHSSQDASSDLGSSFPCFSIYDPSPRSVKCHTLLGLKSPAPPLQPTTGSLAWALPSSSQAWCPTVISLSAFQSPSNLFKEILHWYPSTKTATLQT